MTKYIPDPKGGEHSFVKLTLGYRKAGHSVYNGESHKGGYYCNCKFVERKGSVIKFTIFQGFNYHLLECSRRSKKREQQALEMLKEKETFFVNELNKMRDESDSSHGF